MEITRRRAPVALASLLPRLRLLLPQRLPLRRRPRPRHLQRKLPLLRLLPQKRLLLLKRQRLSKFYLILYSEPASFDGCGLFFVFLVRKTDSLFVI